MSSGDPTNRISAFLRDFLRPAGAKSFRIQLLRIVVSIAVVAGFMVYVANTGNPHVDDPGTAVGSTPSWGPPEPTGPTDPPPPPGFPRIDPPVMTVVPDGAPQSVPTRYGLSYTVPRGNGWRPSESMVVGYTDPAGEHTLAMYGSVSDYGHHYCAERDTSSLAYIGVRGRNGVDAATAARQEIEMVPDLFRGPGLASVPRVDTQGPIGYEIDGRPAVRYTASISGVAKNAPCDAEHSEFTVIATPGYANAEVAVFVFRRHTAIDDTLSPEDAESIIGSIRKTDS